MANKLKAITTKAKALYKSGKFAKWTDAIKAASSSIAGVAPKKKPTKKAPVKKVAAKKLKFNQPKKLHKLTGYNGTTRQGNKTQVHYTKLSGYEPQKEIVVGRIGALSLVKEFAPEVKIRVTRGKKVLTNKILSALDAVNIFKKYITPSKIQTQEFFAVMYCNNAGNVLAVYCHSQGGIQAVTIDTRLILAAALKLAATSLILCHNHPSGNLQPSEADKKLTKNLVDISNSNNIRVSDHVIITKDGYYSFVENGIMR